MTRKWQQFFLWGLVVSGGLINLSAATGTSAPVITIYIYNYAKVAPDTLTEAKKVAAGIFQKAGIELKWAIIALNSTGEPEGSILPTSLSVANIQLNVLPRMMADKFGRSAERMGFAPGAGGKRQQAFVFYQRVQQLAHDRKQLAVAYTDISRILGFVIVHELGHLFGIDTHSPMGIMRADWDSTDLTGLAYGSLLFTPQQEEVLRAEMGRRSTRENDGQVAEQNTFQSAR